MTAPLTDLEITRACAIAAGYQWGIEYGEGETPHESAFIECQHDDGEKFYEAISYDPLHDDGAAMALEWLLIQSGELRYRKGIMRHEPQGSGVGVNHVVDSQQAWRRAICLCVAAMIAPKD